MSYGSEELKIMRERYIRVAAIVTVVIQGFWNIYVVKRRKNSNLTLPLSTCGKQERTMSRGSGSFIRVMSNQHPFLMDWRE